MRAGPDPHDPRLADPLYPPASLGVLGSGQLGRMFLQAAQRMGYRAGVLSEAEDTPAAQVAHWTVIGRDDHLASLQTFCDRSDAVTVEFENVSAPRSAGLPAIARSDPAGARSGSAQNRLREKSFLAGHGIPHAPWHPVRTPDELDAAARALGLPLILKTAASGYDGKGQVARRVGRRPGPRLVRPGRAHRASPRPGSTSPPRSPWSSPGRRRDGRLLPGGAQPPPSPYPR